MLDFTEQIRDDLRALIYDIYRRLEAWLEPFADDLQEFLCTLLKARLPADWRERWHAFVAESAAKGFIVQPQSVVELEAWIEAWAKRRKLLPAVDRGAQLPSRNPQSDATGQIDPYFKASDDAPRGEPDDQKPTDRGANSQAPQQHARPTQTQIREQFFNDKLAEAQRCLDEMKRVLDALGDKLDAARIDETTEVEDEADAVEELIFRYNDALESARDAWLRDDLSGDANARLLGMLTPRAFGLPEYADDAQAERARKQLLLISQRLGQRNVTMNRIVSGAKIVEGIGTGAGILAGVGIVYNAAKIGGKWAVVKVVAAGAAAMVVEQAVEQGLRAAGAGEQTVRGWRLAAAVVLFVILRRKNASASSGPPANTPPSGNPAPPANTSPPPPAGKLPAPTNPSATGRPAPQGPLKNPSGNLDEAARAARTQPHGPNPPRPPAATPGAKPSTAKTYPPIEGTLDTPRTAHHKFLQKAIAEEMQQTGDYNRVGMNLPLSKFSGQSHSPDIRPDNIGLTADGKIDMIEIKSPKQDVEVLMAKLKTAMEQLPTWMRGEFDVTDPGDAFK